MSCGRKDGVGRRLRFGRRGGRKADSRSTVSAWRFLVTVARSVGWVADTWATLVDQGVPFEWIVVLAPGASLGELPKDARVRALTLDAWRGDGDALAKGFAAAIGRHLAVLEAGDRLAEGALATIEGHFKDAEVGFIAGDYATDPMHAASVGADAINAHAVHFGSLEIRGARSTSVHTGPMNAATMSHLHTMPRGLPTWRADVYRSLGGHDARCGVGSTQDLLCRTYLAARCRKTSEVLVVAGRGDTRHDAGPLNAACGDGRNPAYPSAGQPVPLRDRYLHSMVARECDSLGLPRYDIGGGIFGAPGWKTLDVSGAPDVTWDVFGTRRLPFADASVGAFRAFDFLEHGADLDAFWLMDEIHRCLVPGGWFLSYTPHAGGIAASCDPSHRSRWDERRFLYWCSPQLRPFLLSAHPTATAEFEAGRLFVETRVMGPAPWRFEVPYLVADLRRPPAVVGSEPTRSVTFSTAST